MIEQYNITPVVGYFMTDNASSNDSCVDLVLRQLYPDMTAKQRKGRRLRCLGHIINLCAHALLLDKSAAKTVDDAGSNLRNTELDSQELFWRARRAIGKLHNII